MHQFKNHCVSYHICNSNILKVAFRQTKVNTNHSIVNASHLVYVFLKTRPSDQDKKNPAGVGPWPDSLT